MTASLYFQGRLTIFQNKNTGALFVLVSKSKQYKLARSANRRLEACMQEAGFKKGSSGMSLLKSFYKCGLKNDIFINFIFVFALFKYYYGLCKTKKTYKLK